MGPRITLREGALLGTYLGMPRHACGRYTQRYPPGCSNDVASNHLSTVATRCHFLISSPALREAQARRAYVLLMFFYLKNILVISVSVRPIISTSTGPTFTKFSALVELWP